MINYALVPYALRVYNFEDRKPLKLNNLDGNGKDFFNVFSSCLKDNYTHKVFPDLYQTIRCKSDFIKERTIDGIMGSGKYGVIEDLYNVSTGEFRERGKSKDDAGEKPFYFLLNAPEEMYAGTLIIQTISNSGIKTVFERLLNEYLNSSNYKITLNPLISKELLKKLQTSKSIYEIRFIKRNHPLDKTEFFDYNYDEKNVTKMEVYRPKNKLFFNLKNEFITYISNTELNYYEIMGEKCDKIQIILNEGGKKVTLNFTGRTTHNLESYELSEMHMGVDGNFNFPYIRDEATNYLNRILNERGN